MQLAVTGVYTSQGCTFPRRGDDRRAAIGLQRPVSIEVVPQVGVPFTLPPAP